MQKPIPKSLRISLSEDCFIELNVIAMRKRIDIKDLISDILENYTNKRKEKEPTQV